MSGKYDDMLFLPHHVSAGHPQMSRHDRAAQFSPFAALSGYDAVLQEAGRLTQPQKELDEGVQAELNGQLRVLAGLLDQHPDLVPARREKRGWRLLGCHRGGPQN